MNTKLPLIAMLLLPGCTDSSNGANAAAAAGSIANTPAAPATTKAPAPLDHKALDIKPQNIQKIDPVQPNTPPPPPEIGGARFGARHRPDRRLVKLS
jgi:hypothetical protein